MMKRSKKYNKNTCVDVVYNIVLTKGNYILNFIVFVYKLKYLL